MGLCNHHTIDAASSTAALVLREGAWALAKATNHSGQDLLMATTATQPLIAPASSLGLGRV